jgi:two-component system sensor histidine kinase PhoQ
MAINGLLRRYFSLNSLVGRFVLSSLLLLPLFLFLTGQLLINTFEHSQLKSEQEKLQTQLYLLVGLTDLVEKQPVLPEAFAEPRFNLQNSGLYGMVFDKQDTILWLSPSATLLSPELLKPNQVFNTGQTFFFHKNSASNLRLNIFGQDIDWVNEDESVTSLRFVIASDSAGMRSELTAYKNRLWQWLSIMGFGLLIIQMLIMTWGLQPLKQLSQQLTALKENKISTLDNQYPEEIQPVTDSFNQILVHEKQQRERYRNTMSDLAHSLKTPLAVIQSHVEKEGESKSIENKNGETDETIREQLDRINQIISHQLKRAVIRVNQNVINSQTDKISIKAMVDRLIKILSKVYIDKNVQFSNLISDDIFFFGDEADLLEVMGNLMDNACKYGKDAVVIYGNKNNDTTNISISDNGDGINESLKSTLLIRGARGDTAQAGQGIGLSVAVDIISSYGGGLSVKNNIGDPHLSGACFSISLPQAVK